MIALDIETSGMNIEKCGIFQIGALEIEGNREFFEEARIDNEDLVLDEALKLTNKTENELRDKNKQSQKQMLEKFFQFVENSKTKNLLCQNPSALDIPIIAIKAKKYGLKTPFHYRAFDLHTLAQTVYYKKYGKFLIKDGKSDMGLSNVLKMVGKEDDRIQTRDGKIVKEGKEHNAREDARLTAECFKKLVGEL